MKNIAIITARSGSKGLPDKNIRTLSGKPLMYYSIKAAAESKLFDTIMVSTDSQKYANIARQFGADVPFLRSEFTSGDNANSWDVVTEVLKNYQELGKKFDTVCLLQPTSPLRKAEDIIEGYNLMVTECCNSVTAVCEMEHSPLWSMTLPDDLCLDDYRKKSIDVPRQKMEKYYRINGALYIRKINYSNHGISFCLSNEYALIMERNRSVDIDTLEDFEYAEWLMNR